MTNPESLDFRNPESHSEEELRIIAKKRGKNVLSAAERIELEQEKAKIIERSRERQRSISGLQTLIDGQGEEEEYIIPTSDPEPVEPEPREDLTSEDQSPESKTRPESETTHRAKIEYIKKKNNKNVAFRNFMSGVAVVAVASILGASIPTNGFGLLNKDRVRQSVPTESPAIVQTAETEPTLSATTVQKEAGQDGSAFINVGKLENGLSYDYRERDDINNKANDECFGYDYSDLYGDEDGTLGAYLSQARRNPEIMAAYAIGHLTESEKDALGIAGCDHNSLSKILEESSDGGNLQKAILEIMEKDDSSVKFGEVASTWLTTPAQDKNNDGGSQPNEVEYGTEKSGVVKVAYVYRTLEDGRKILANILYMEHGLEIPVGQVYHPEPTGHQSKQGDPGGGSDVAYSGIVNPASEFSQDQNNQTNEGNQGTTDAAPGSASTPENNGGFTQIPAQDADTSGERLSGGENQSGGGVVGAENNSSDAGSQVDQGDINQNQANEAGIIAGGSNYNEQQQVDKVNSGDF